MGDTSERFEPVRLCCKPNCANRALKGKSYCLQHMPRQVTDVGKCLAALEQSFGEVNRRVTVLEKRLLPECREERPKAGFDLWQRVEKLEEWVQLHEDALAADSRRLLELEARAKREDEGLRAEVDKREGDVCARCGGRGWYRSGATDLQVKCRSCYPVQVDKQEPAPVATVGVKCPRCDGKGWQRSTMHDVGLDCCTCLGHGIVHTHAEYLALEADRDLYRLALHYACGLGPNGQYNEHRWLTLARNALAEEAAVKEARP